MSGAKWSARRVAAEVLYRVESREAYAGMALDSFFQKHPVPARERAFATELVYGALRRRNTLHWLLEQVSRRPLTEIDPRLLAILETAVYQLWFLSGSPEYAVVHEAVELARQGGHAGTAGFVNGVLRELLRQRWQISYPDPKEDPAGHLSLAGSHPRWLVERWLGRWGFSEVQRLCALNNQPPPVVIRVNTLRTDGAGLAAALARDGYICRPGRWVAEALQLQAGEVPLAKTSAWQDGLCQVQDESSMMASLVLDPRPGQFVLDVCSAPGGKTTHLAALMKNRGRLLAIDVHAHRLRLVAENCRRLGVSIVQTCPGDARRVLPNLPNLADRILLDAPCSGTGVLRRRPDARWRINPNQIRDLPVLQGELLQAAANCLRPGGRLVYSTCSIEPEENEQVVARFLAERSDYKAVDPPANLLQGLTAVKPGMGVQLLPHRHGVDGFFIACLERVSRQE
ncbi:MAG TPA: 16S rRNA (cytosine(967)-C(5))-methyltransferase RsmB [Firmicutes bacterium]|nr:16S rRNA (cytosine(967)-C(5))-methyltransferase RsmB [Bacillota bacterium]